MGMIHIGKPELTQLVSIYQIFWTEFNISKTTHLFVL